MREQRIAILASGPSLLDVYPNIKYSYETVIAVNSAADHFEHHWAVFIDGQTEELHRAGKTKETKIGYVSSERMRDFAHARGKSFRPFPGKMVGCMWSFANALFFANSLNRNDGTFHVDVFGFDCAFNQPDCSGRVCNHSEDRFSRELVWVRAAWSKNFSIYSEVLPRSIKDWLTGESQNLNITKPPIK